MIHMLHSSTMIGLSFNLSAEYTGLEKGDYLFLQRFLDSTKSNLFFAKGIIMVEGDAESLLIPTLADVIGINLEKHLLYNNQRKKSQKQCEKNILVLQVKRESSLSY